MRVSQLQSWDAGAPLTCSRVLGEVITDIGEAAMSLGGNASRILFADARWQGTTATAAGAVLQRRTAACSAVADALGDAAAALNIFAAAIGEAKATLARGMAAAGPRIVIADDGSVSVTPPPNCDPDTTYPTNVAYVQSCVSEALSHAAAADSFCAATLADVETILDLLLGRVDPMALAELNRATMTPLQWEQYLATVPPPGTDPRVVAEWWASHDPLQQEALLSADPHRIGNLDGLPPDARDRANRRYLDAHISELQARMDAIVAENRAATGLGMAGSRFRGIDLVELGELGKELSWYSKVREQLLAYAAVDVRDNRTGTQPVVQLLAMDRDAYSGGKVALAFGDLATARDVTYVVPGLNQTVDPELGRTVGNAWRTYQQTGKDDPTRSGAVVAWMGYETPGFSNVAWDHAADHGADRLKVELDALHAVRTGNPPHIVVVAHSYGSTTAALAAARYDLGIDDLVLVGSPGATVDNASALHVPAGHVWVGAASGDIVTWLRHFNIDPGTAPFGAQRFEAETASRTTDESKSINEHSHYFDDSSESLRNISRIVRQRPDAVLVAPYRQDDLVVIATPYSVQTFGAENDPENDRPVTTDP